MVKTPAVSARRHAAFTLVELLVVMAIIATLLSVAAPRYFAGVERSREAVLKENLRVMRSSIDQYHADHDRYPDALDVLAAKRYMRSVPVDPITESATTWIAVPPPPPLTGAVYDVKSGAAGKALDGTPYGEW